MFGALLSGRLVHDSPPCAAPSNFSIALAPSRARVKQGQNARYTVSLRAPAGFSDDVRMSLSGATGRFSEDRVRPPASTVLTVTTSQKTLPGTYPILVTGRTESRVGRVRVMLVVFPA